jgi:hypothetical protein
MLQQRTGVAKSAAVMPQFEWLQKNARSTKPVLRGMRGIFSDLNQFPNFLYCKEGRRNSSSPALATPRVVVKTDKPAKKAMLSEVARKPFRNTNPEMARIHIRK